MGEQGDDWAALPGEEVVAPAAGFSFTSHTRTTSLSFTRFTATALSFDFTAHTRTRTFACTACTRTSAFSFTHFKRQQATLSFEVVQPQPITDVEAAQLHLAPPILARSTLSVSLSRQPMKVTGHQGHLSFRVHPWTLTGVVQFLVRALRRYQMLEEAELRALFQGWPAARGSPDFPDLRRFPLIFVPSPFGQWTLTTWARLGVPFRLSAPVAWGWSREGYVREAARFWLERGHLPNEEQELDREVRALVATTLTTPPLPPYVVPCRAGPFHQVTFRGRVEYRLDLDQMPEGPYFTLRTGGSEVTYSVEGRALLADTAWGVNVVTPFLTLRIKEALLLPVGDERITWLPTGLAFRETLERCGLTVKESQPGF